MKEKQQQQYHVQTEAFIKHHLEHCYNQWERNGNLLTIGSILDN